MHKQDISAHSSAQQLAKPEAVQVGAPDSKARRRRLVAGFALVFGNVAIAVSPVFVRISDVGPISAGFWRLALAVPILWIISHYLGERAAKIPRSALYLAAIAGLIFAADLICWHLGIFRTKLGNATLFGNSASIFLVIYGVIIARKLPPPFQIGAVILAFSGAMLLLGQSFELSPRNLMGDLLSLAAGIFYTFYLLIIMRLRTSVGGWSILFWVSVFSAIAMLAGAAIAGEQIWPEIWWPLVLLALSSQVIGTGLMTYALPYFNHLVIGLTLLLQPALAAIIGWLLFSETLTDADAIGGIMVMAALLMMHFSQSEA
jgi:drug/metabolite transporter (DMT)-like permease